jgi:hypothetical protein
MAASQADFQRKGAIKGSVPALGAKKLQICVCGAGLIGCGLREAVFPCVSDIGGPVLEKPQQDAPESPVLKLGASLGSISHGSEDSGLSSGDGVVTLRVFAGKSIVSPGSLYKAVAANHSTTALQVRPLCARKLDFRIIFPRGFVSTGVYVVYVCVNGAS